jgi:hypothetical protein
LSVYNLYASGKTPLLREEISALTPMETMAKVRASWRKLLEQENLVYKSKSEALNHKEKVDASTDADKVDPYIKPKSSRYVDKNVGYIFHHPFFVFFALHFIFNLELRPTLTPGSTI